MTRSSTKELFTPLENPERVFCSKRRLFETPGLVESSSPEFDLFSDIEERDSRPNNALSFPMSLTGAASRWLRNEPSAQLNNLGRKIKKVNEKVYAAQVGCELCKYRAAGPGFYQRDNGNSSYPDRRQTMEESLTKFMAESAKRHEENSNIIKELRASTDAAIRNQGASIKTLEIQIGQMSKVLK
ncbi:hypothetical protein Tco_0949543 [Tanacetum coccineum]